jgi:predicted DNA-binding transcriptional regulator AlpA
MSRNGARAHFAGALPQPALPERLALLAERWREDGAALRRRGAAPFAELLDQCAVELTGVLAGNGDAAAPERRAPEAKVADRLLTTEQVAERLATTPAWVYAHWKALGFGQKLGRRTLRFSERALERHLARAPARAG